MQHEATLKKIAIMQAFVDGQAIQGKYGSNSNWINIHTPNWEWGCAEYRIKPSTPDVLPWEHIHPRWEWYARDRDGHCWLYENEPGNTNGNTFNSSRGITRDITQTIVVQIGDVPWERSKQRRPE